ncbi:TPA: glycosyl transferase [Candidatus Sumerlaeota bacterium]|nr:glycosyl transferase [Candidatus Sumerlaeota bacterium]
MGGEEKMLFISLIIPAFNEEKCIVECLRSVRAAFEKVAATQSFDYEVVVVDNNSTDRTAELARSEGARVVFEAVNQIARARNRGAAEAQGEWFIFLDADSLLSAELLAGTVAAIQRGNVAGGGSLIRFPKGAKFSIRVSAALWNTISRTARLAAGSYIYCRQDLFWRAGGFDEKIYASEDVGFCRRLKRIACPLKLRFVVLKRHPLLTSDRKAELYTLREVLWLFFRMLVAPKRTCGDPKSCHIWYDGRR